MTSRNGNEIIIQIILKPFKHQPHKMVKHTQTIRRQHPDFRFALNIDIFKARFDWCF